MNILSKLLRGEESKDTVAKEPGLNDPTPAALLLEQYKMLEERRMYFGSQFMQVTGGAVAIFTVFVGLVGGKAETLSLLRPAFFFGGIAFMLLAILGYRLGKRQDDCEEAMSQLEVAFRTMNYAKIVSLPRGAKVFGARAAIICVLFLTGAALSVVGVVEALFLKVVS